jgi:hypothetical protein
MPVYKYRSIEDMPDTPWYEPGDPRLFEALVRLAELSQRLHPRRHRPGVMKFRSIEEMSAYQQRHDAGSDV